MIKDIIVKFRYKINSPIFQKDLYFIKSIYFKYHEKKLSDCVYVERNDIFTTEEDFFTRINADTKRFRQNNQLDWLESITYDYSEMIENPSEKPVYEDDIDYGRVKVIGDESEIFMMRLYIQKSDEEDKYTLSNIHFIFMNGLSQTKSYKDSKVDNPLKYFRIIEKTCEKYDWSLDNEPYVQIVYEDESKYKNWDYYYSIDKNKLIACNELHLKTIIQGFSYNYLIDKEGIRKIAILTTKGSNVIDFLLLVLDNSYVIYPLVHGRLYVDDSLFSLNKGTETYRNYISVKNKTGRYILDKELIIEELKDEGYNVSESVDFIINPIAVNLKKYEYDDFIRPYSSLNKFKRYKIV